LAWSDRWSRGAPGPPGPARFGAPCPVRGPCTCPSGRGGGRRRRPWPSPASPPAQHELRRRAVVGRELGKVVHHEPPGLDPSPPRRCGSDYHRRCCHGLTLLPTWPFASSPARCGPARLRRREDSHGMDGGCCLGVFAQTRCADQRRHRQGVPVSRRSMRKGTTKRTRVGSRADRACAERVVDASMIIARPGTVNTRRSSEVVKPVSSPRRRNLPAPQEYLVDVAPEPATPGGVLRVEQAVEPRSVRDLGPLDRLPGHRRPRFRMLESNALAVPPPIACWSLTICQNSSLPGENHGYRSRTRFA
jgi:hypothetical protein